MPTDLTIRCRRLTAIVATNTHAGGTPEALGLEKMKLTIYAIVHSLSSYSNGHNLWLVLRSSSSPTSPQLIPERALAKHRHTASFSGGEQVGKTASSTVGNRIVSESPKRHRLSLPYERHLPGCRPLDLCGKHNVIVDKVGNAVL